jgi:AcrR family transcriptional regulator
VSAHRSRILAAALEVTGAEGWGAVTMARLASMTGVSRQTVYNEVGAKPSLAQALVADQLARFMHLVESAFARHAGDPVAAVRDAVAGVLELAEKNPVTRAVVSGSQGVEQDLVPLLTTRSDLIIEGATATVREGLADSAADLPGSTLDALVDAIVRVTLSHIVQPRETPERVADGLATITAATLAAVRR